MEGGGRKYTVSERVLKNLELASCCIKITYVLFPEPAVLSKKQVFRILEMTNSFITNTRKSRAQ